MTELAAKILKDYGFPTLVAAFLGAMLWQTGANSAEERASHTAVLIDQLSDLREKVSRLEATCHGK
jgi:hypothetical protein